MKLKYNLLLVALLMLGSWAKGDPEKKIQNNKRITKGFSITKDATVEIKNKYGDIVVKTWNQDSVKFDIIITSKHEHEDVVADLLENTSVKFSDSRTYLVANTVFEEGGSAILGGLSKLKDIVVDNGKNGLSINYTVHIPANANLTINNRFGDVQLDNLSGNVKTDLWYGDLRLGDMDGYLNATVQFGDLNGHSLQRLNLTAEYADVVIYEVQNADINSRSSKINIQKADKIRCRSKRDDFTIYQVNSISSDATYSNYVISELASNLNITGKYGNITVHNVAHDFDKMSLNTVNSNANFSFADNANFSVDIHLEEGDLSYPQHVGKITEKVVDEEDEKKNYFGTIGTASSPRSSLEIFGDNTDVNISIK